MLVKNAANRIAKVERPKGSTRLFSKGAAQREIASVNIVDETAEGQKDSVGAKLASCGDDPANRPF